MDLWTILLLLGQTVFAVLGLRQLIGHVFPALNAVDHPGLIVDVWTPIALVCPLLFLAPGVGYSVQGQGWAPVAAPVCIGLFTIGAAVFVGPSDSMKTRVAEWPLTSWAGVGLLLLMLGMAHTLTIWTGQCAFALAAVILWMNTPTLDHHAPAASPQANHRAGIAMLLALIFAAGQGAIATRLPADVLPISVTMMIAYAASAGAAAARIAGFNRCVRIGGWAATIGLLLGLGILSLSHLLPQVLAFALRSSGMMDANVVHGFGAYALEGMLLAALPAAAVLAPSLNRVSQRLLGAALIVLAAAITAFRVVNL